MKLRGTVLIDGRERAVIDRKRPAGQNVPAPKVEREHFPVSWSVSNAVGGDVQPRWDRTEINYRRAQNTQRHASIQAEIGRYAQTFGPENLCLAGALGIKSIDYAKKLLVVAVKDGAELPIHIKNLR